MYFDFGKIFKFLLILALGIAIGVGTMKIIERYKAPKQTVTVVGTGEVDAATDQATISIQVTEKKDAQKLKDALIQMGIPESRITQSSFTPPIYQMGGATIDKMMYPQPNPNPATATSYTVVLDSLKNIEKVFAAINANPNTQITSTYYSLNKRKEWEAKAKEMALNDARNQIESVAKINRLRVGKLVSLEDANNPRPFQLMKALNGTAPTEDQSFSTSQEGANQQTTNNAYYSEQTVKINASYTAVYELY